MELVGLTGGIGSGKSTVARLLAGRGAVVLDADRIARQVVEPGTEGLAEIEERFGTEVIRDDGTLDRARLARIVFADDAARADLEAITHPRIRRVIAERLDDLRDHPGLVVLDVPLMLESGLVERRHLDALVVVVAPEQVRLERLVERGMDPDDADARIRAQVTDEQRRAHADHVLDNSGDLAQLEEAVDALYRDLTAGRPRSTT